MCDPTLALMGASMFLAYKGQRDAVKRAERALNRTEDNNDRYTQKAIDVSNENAGQYDPNVRNENQEASRVQAEQSLLQTLTEARDAGIGDKSDATQGRVSESYDNLRDQRMQEVADKGVDLASMMAALRSATDLRRNEGLNNADAASQLGIIRANQQAAANAGAIDVQQAGQVDPLSQAIGAAGAGYASGMGFNGGTPTTPTINNQNYPYTPAVRRQPSSITRR